jgi:CheY-like chemotaxis protein
MDNVGSRRKSPNLAPHGMMFALTSGDHYPNVRATAMDNLKLLIAEDNSFSRKFYDNYISDKVFDKRFAENGRQALDIYAEWRPDIILLDLMMPVMSGQEVLQQIREARKDLATTIIISSLSSHKDDVTICAHYGVQGYLVKPLNPKEISRILLQLYKQANPRKAADIVALMQYL